MVEKNETAVNPEVTGVPDPVEPEAPKELVPTQPKGLTDDDLSEIQSKVDEYYSEVEQRPSSLALVRTVGRLGADSQLESSNQFGLLQTKVGSLLNGLEGEGAQIPNNLAKCRNTMDQLNPDALMKPRGILRRIPGIGKILIEIAQKHETVQRQIDDIIGTLKANDDQLLQDGIELEQLYNKVQQAQLGIQKSAFLGELLWKRIEEKIAETDDPTEHRNLQRILSRVAIRVQDLRTIEQANVQSFAGIGLIIDTNTSVSDSINRMVTVVRSLITVGLAISVAVAHQQKAIKALKVTKEFSEDLLRANARAIKEGSIQAAQLENEPVLALEAIKDGFGELMSAFDEVEKIRTKGVEAARNGVSQLSDMTKQLQPRVDALRKSAEDSGGQRESDEERRLEE